jgi:hypothetical protein
LPKRLEVDEDEGIAVEVVEEGGRTLVGEMEPFEAKAGRSAVCASGVDTGRATDFGGGLGKIIEWEEEGVEGDSRVLKLTRFDWLLFGTCTVRAGGGTASGRRVEFGERLREESARRKESTVSFSFEFDNARRARSRTSACGLILYEAQCDQLRRTR